MNTILIVASVIGIIVCAVGLVLTYKAGVRVGKRSITKILNIPKGYVITSIGYGKKRETK